MLILSSGSCGKCGESCLPTTQKEASVACKKAVKISSCSTCKQKGCPTCGGKLESQMDWASKNGILF